MPEQTVLRERERVKKSSLLLLEESVKATKHLFEVIKYSITLGDAA